MKPTTQPWRTYEPTWAERLARTTLTKWQLMDAFFGSGRLTVNGIEVGLASMQREDGSGSSFNLILNKGLNSYACYCRTTD
jgi:hypothetical protein